MNDRFSSKRPLTSEEEADIQLMIASDPELIDAQLAGQSTTFTIRFREGCRKTQAPGASPPHTVISR